MSKTDRNRISEIRQKILSIIKAIDRLLKIIIDTQLVTKGTICEKRRKCGHARCKCSGGELHVTKILSFSHKGKSRIIHLSKYTEKDLSRLERQVKDYQRFRKSRARLVYYFKLLIREINRMEQNISMEAAPPDKGGENEG